MKKEGQAVSWDKSFLHGREAESSSSLFSLSPSCTRLSFCLIVILNPHATVQTTSQIHIQLASLSKLSVVPSPSYRVSSGRSSLLSFILSQESPVGSTSLRFCSSHFFHPAHSQIRNPTSSTNSSNFLAILSYWTAFFIVIVAEEHFIFRRKGGPLGGYDLDSYDDWNRCV